MPEALLVDDDEPFLAALSEAISREKFSARTATSLAAAKLALAGNPPDVVLLDLYLPDGSGMELLEDLAALPATEVVLITGKASVETAVEALRRGAADYLVKPVDLARVRTVLANVTRTRELKRVAAKLPWARLPASGEALPVIFGRYDVEAEIGEGSMGRVYRCRDPLVGRQVAVKVVKSEYLAGETREDYLRRFRHEAQAAGILSHPSIVGIYDVGDDYIVMEYVEGATLYQLLRDQRALEFPAALRVLAPLAEALDYAHRMGVIHRDIKPANIIVQPDGRPKLMDFGVARLESSTVTGTGQVFGSPSYMSPEQILGAPSTPHADVFSFAVVAYEALTGHRPFYGDTVAATVYRVVHEPARAPSLLNPRLPPACDAVFARALSKSPEERYPDANGFVAALVGAESSTGAPSISEETLLESLVASAPAEARARAAAVPGPEAAVRQPPPVRTRARRWRYVAAVLALVALLPALLWGARRVISPGAEAGPLRVETQPPGMPVWIDGLRAGVSPLEVPLTHGNHRVRVAQEGFAPAELTLHVEPGTTAAPLQFVMARLRGAEARAAVSPPPPAPTALRPGPDEEARPAAAAAGPFWTRVEAPPAASPAPAAASTPLPLREGDLVDVTPDVQPPRRIAGELPGYPDAARRFGLSGSVLVEILVSERGEPQEVRVLESAGAILDQAVIAAAYRWRFEPAVRDGVKVRVRWPYRHTFTAR